MAFEEVTIDDNRLICGDALAVLPTLPSASVNLICVDPPYFRVKTEYLGAKVLWDRQWPTRDAYLAWLRQLAQEWQRLLTPNGSLYCFASPQMAAWVEVMLSKLFAIIQRITWRKPPYTTKAEMFKKDELHMFFPVSEAILFAEHLHSDAIALGASGYAAQCAEVHGHVFEPLRAYLDGERRRAAIDKTACNAACGFAAIPGGMASRHYFSTSQWALPTQAHYAALRVLFNSQGRQPAPPFADFHPAGNFFAKFHPTPHADYEHLRADYEYLRADYEHLRRPFAVSAHVPYTDVWDFATVPAAPGKHPAEKPLPLLRHIILASSRPGDMVLDCCAGSFSTLDAARQCGRKGIGIEQDRQWWQRGQERLSQGDLWSLPVTSTGPTRALATQGKLL